MTTTRADQETATYLRSVLNFLVVAEKLKTELRHSWTSNKGRQESVAEHTWMMCLLAITLFERIDTSLDKLKCLKMIIVHDLAEAVVGDIPAFEKSKRKEAKYLNESAAIRKIANILADKSFGQEIITLWEEFEKSVTIEAQFAIAMDKLEVLTQHNLADISTWQDGDFALNPYYKNDKFDFDKLLRALKDIVDIDTMQKIEASKMLSRVSAKHTDIWKKNKTLRALR